MTSDKRYMITINLHEVDFLEKTLAILVDNFVRDCVVYNAEGIASRHSNENLSSSFGFIASSLSSMFKESRNLNNVILAIVKKDKMDIIYNKLKALHKENRHAASFWFTPVENYFYHKGIED